jgi:putative transposase
MVSAQARREQVAFARRRGLSCRRACALLSVARSALTYESKMPEKDKALAGELRALSTKHPRWGYRMVRNWLSAQVSYSRVYRVWKQNGLCLPKRRPRKRIRGDGHRWMSAVNPNAVWAYDFAHDECANGQKLKCLVVVDEWTHESLAIQVGARMRSRDVIDVLSRLFSLYGPPAFLRSDNGPEFVAKAVQRWLRRQGVQTSYIEPGKPWQNGVAESFVNRFRDDCLGVEWFNNRLEAKVFIEAWRKEYNTNRPHSSNGYKTPAETRQDWLTRFGPKWGIKYEHQPRRLSA